MTQVSTDHIRSLVSVEMTGKSYYECHVTLMCPRGLLLGLPYPDDLRDAVESLRWKFSQIEGDIALGGGVKCYATMHYNSRTPVDDVVALLHKTADTLKGYGYEVIRRKVELVIYDDRSTKIQPGTCEGACVGCHLDDYEEAKRLSDEEKQKALLNKMVDAWEELPGGHQVRNKDVERWLNSHMSIAINAIRGYLQRARPDGVTPEDPFK